MEFPSYSFHSLCLAARQWISSWDERSFDVGQGSTTKVRISWLEHLFPACVANTNQIGKKSIQNLMNFVVERFSLLPSRPDSAQCGERQVYLFISSSQSPWKINNPCSKCDPIPITFLHRCVQLLVKKLRVTWFFCVGIFKIRLTQFSQRYHFYVEQFGGLWVGFSKQEHLASEKVDTKSNFVVFSYFASSFPISKQIWNKIGLMENSEANFFRFGGDFFTGWGKSSVS